MVLTPRDIRIITDVSEYQMLSRKQLTHLGHFGSKTRANAILSRLTRFGYLSRRHLPAVAGTNHGLYFLGPTSAALLGTPKQTLATRRRNVRQISDLFLAHQMLITDVRLCFQKAPNLPVQRWMNEAALRERELGVIPDGHIEYRYQDKAFGVFLEVDRGTETLTRFREKAAGYLRLAASGKYREVFGRLYFRVLVVAPSALRIAHLRQVIARETDRIFWLTSLPELFSHGPLASIWFRPVGEQLHSLTEP